MLGECGLQIVYLDDRSGFVDSIGALRMVLQAWAECAEVSGLEINAEKTQIWGRDPESTQLLLQE
eukprot:8023379-Alexandrium_andersonii.AAC.1